MSADLLSDNVAPAADAGVPDAGQAPPSTGSQGAAPDSGVGWLPDSYSNEPSLKDFKNVDGLIKSYMSLNSERGRSIRIPGDDAGQEDLDKFYSKVEQVKGVMRKPQADNPEVMNKFWNSIGRPEEASGYNIDLGQDNQYLHAESFEGFKKAAHEAGLTVSQAKKVIEFDVSRHKALAAQNTNAAANAVSVLQKRWGKEYDGRMAGAKASFRTYQAQFPEAFKELQMVAANNPALVAILSDNGKIMQEKGFIDAPTSYGGNTPGEAKERIAEIRNNKAHAFHDKSNGKAYEEARSTMKRYYKEAYGE